MTQLATEQPDQRQESFLEKMRALSEEPTTRPAGTGFLQKMEAMAEQPVSPEAERALEPLRRRADELSTALDRARDPGQRAELQRLAGVTERRIGEKRKAYMRLGATPMWKRIEQEMRQEQGLPPAEQPSVAERYFEELGRQPENVNLATRAIGTFLNDLALRDIESMRPDTLAGESVGTATDMLTDPLSGEGLKDIKKGGISGTAKGAVKLWAGMIRGWWKPRREAEGKPSARATMRRAAQAARVATGGLPTAEVEMPPPGTLPEKIAAAGGGLVAFLTRLYVAKKLVPPQVAATSPVLSEMLAWELINTEGPPGTGAMMAGTLGAIRQLKTVGKLATAGKLGAQSTLFVGLSQVHGGGLEEAIIAASIPPALWAIPALKPRIRAVFKGVRNAKGLRVAWAKSRQLARKELGVPLRATEQQIRDAFRARIKQTHPDLKQPEADAMAVQNAVQARDFLLKGRPGWAAMRGLRAMPQYEPVAPVGPRAPAEAPAEPTRKALPGPQVAAPAEGTAIKTTAGTIQIPPGSLEGDWKAALGTIFDFGNPREGRPEQPGLSRSLSMGDTIEYEGKTWLVMPEGFQDVSALTPEQIKKLTTLEVPGQPPLQVRPPLPEDTKRWDRKPLPERLEESAVNRTYGSMGRAFVEVLANSPGPLTYVEMFDAYKRVHRTTKDFRRDASRVLTRLWDQGFMERRYRPDGTPEYRPTRQGLELLAREFRYSWAKAALAKLDKKPAEKPPVIERKAPLDRKALREKLEKKKQRALRSKQGRQRKALEREITAYYEKEFGEPIEAELDRAQGDMGISPEQRHTLGEMTTHFGGKIPTELTEALEGRFDLRAKLKGNVQGAVGEDLLFEIGVEEYVRRLELLFGRRERLVELAIERIRRIPKGEVSLEALLKIEQYEALGFGKGDVAAQVEMVPLNQLDKGDTFTVGGEQYRVTGTSEKRGLITLRDGHSGVYDIDETIPVDLGSVKKGEAAPEKPTPPAAIAGETDLFGRPVVQPIRGKQGEFGFEPGEAPVAPIGAVAVKPELIAEVKKAFAAHEGQGGTIEGFLRTSPQDIYGIVAETVDGPAAELFNTPDNPIPEIREAMERVTKGTSLFGEEPTAPAGEGMAAVGKGRGYGPVPPAVTPAQRSRRADARQAASAEGPPPAGLFRRAADDALAIVAPAKRTQAREAALVVRKALAELARKADIADRDLCRAWYSFELRSNKKNLDFIDQMETGEPQEDPKLQAIADTMRRMYDGRRNEVRALGTGRLKHCIENYFAHIWKDPKGAKSIIAKFLGRRALAGPKAFLKKRTIMTTRDGVERGLEPVSWNPVDMTLLKIHEMDRYIMAHRLIAELKQRSLIRFVYARSPAPEGYTAIDDSAFQVYLPPEITIKEAYDEVLVDNLMALAKSLGIDAERHMKIRGRRWGFAKGKRAVTKFAAPESVLAHEIGHVLGKEYSLLDHITRRGETEPHRITRGPRKGQVIQRPTKAAVEHRRTVNKELRALADARFEGHDPPASFRKYVRRGTEKEAVMVEALVHAREKFKEVAPAVYGELVRFLNTRGDLRPLLDIKPSVVLGEGEGKMALPGVTKLGAYYAPDAVAALLNNHLSPGLRGHRNMLIRGTFSGVRHIGNTLIQAELSLSLFHAFNTTFDVMGTNLGLGMRQLFTPGQTLAAIPRILKTPIAPALNIWRGHRLMKAYRKRLKDIADPKLRQMVEAVITAGGRGRMDPLYHERAVRALTRTVHNILHGPGLKRPLGVAALPFNTARAALELVSKPIMEWLVPHQKLGAFYILAQHEMQRLADGQIDEGQFHERLAQSWDNVDNRMGQLVYDNLFWNRYLRDSLFLAIRSVGWNLGSFREFLGAPIDVITTPWRMKRGDAVLSQKTAYTIALAMIYAAVGGTITYLLTGERPKELTDYFFPKTGRTNPDGTDERLVLPVYARDWWAWAKQPAETAKNKMNPTLNAAAEAWTNKDFFGTEIRHKDDPWIQQLTDTAEYLAGRFRPFSVQNYQRMRREGSGRWRAGLVSAGGIRRAPQYITLTPARQLALEYIVARLPQGARTKEDFERTRAAKDIKRKFRAGKLTRKEVVRQAAGIGLKPLEANRLMRDLAYTKWQETFRRLSFAEAVNVYMLASPKERKEVLAILVDKHARARPDKRGFRDIEALYRELVPGDTEDQGTFRRRGAPRRR